ncbi:MAG: hypothetical protein HQK81_02545 [Desulfovibrionaceae bacterium]|nr:hypothetical protein [Desulfovibrionaceae bacterium]MBF0512924.1 hypothetical protein [Desulfovibrionaceae bacterium]
MNIPTLQKTVRPLLAFLAIAPLLLAAAMAFVSKIDAHPDEINHIEAGRYYLTYFDPPRAGDPRTLESLSKYGISYLNQFESVYFAAGNFAKIFTLCGLPDYLALRLFNLTLFGLLIALALSLPGRAKIAFLPLYLSPQIWYVFSYFNGDGLPLALSFVPVWLAARGLFPPDAGALDAPAPDEEDEPEEETEEDARPAWRTWALTLCVAAALVTCKMNYYVYIAYLFAFAAGVAANRGRWRAAGKIVLACAVVALLGLAAREQFDGYVNAGETNKAQMVAEQFAQQDFKPSSQDIGVAHFGMHMRAMGLSYKDLFVVWDWHVWTFRTSFGTYDYMKIYAPFIYYRYMSWALIGLCLAAFLPLFRGGREPALLAAMCLFFGAACIFQSTWHSWVDDFQAQGRYLFPIAAMAGLLMARFRDRLTNIFIPVCAGAMYALSIYSFVFVGLAQIPK